MSLSLVKTRSRNFDPPEIEERQLAAILQSLVGYRKRA
jgi:hypothetical protein